MSLSKFLAAFLIGLVLCMFSVDRLLNAQSLQEIGADNPNFHYIGRIDRTDVLAPVFNFPGTACQFNFQGPILKLKLSDDNWGGNNYVGVYLDDNPQPTVIYLDGGSSTKEYLVSDKLEHKKHSALIIKRNDYINGGFTFHGISIAPGRQILAPNPAASRKIEVYGDSISAGGTVEYPQTGTPDPTGDSSPLANGYLTFGWMLARDYDAEVHLIAQGGIPLVDGYGFWHENTGMEVVYDRIKPLKDSPTWNFANYHPELVIIALGQNDSATISESQLSSEAWRTHYREFIANLRSKHPEAYIICMFPNMFHDPKWDGYLTAAVAEYQQTSGDYKVYSLINEAVTPGHPREAEQRLMADALSNLIENQLNPAGLNWN
jgi:hypothetical protein